MLNKNKRILMGTGAVIGTAGMVAAVAIPLSLRDHNDSDHMGSNTGTTVQRIDENKGTPIGNIQAAPVITKSDQVILATKFQKDATDPVVKLDGDKVNVIYKGTITPRTVTAPAATTAGAAKHSIYEMAMYVNHDANAATLDTAIVQFDKTTGEFVAYQENDEIFNKADFMKTFNIDDSAMTAMHVSKTDMDSATFVLDDYRKANTVAAIDAVLPVTVSGTTAVTEPTVAIAKTAQGAAATAMTAATDKPTVDAAKKLMEDANTAMKAANAKQDTENAKIKPAAPVASVALTFTDDEFKALLDSDTGKVNTAKAQAAHVTITKGPEQFPAAGTTGSITYTAAPITSAAAPYTLAKTSYSISFTAAAHINSPQENVDADKAAFGTLTLTAIGTKVLPTAAVADIAEINKLVSGVPTIASPKTTISYSLIASTTTPGSVELTITLTDKTDGTVTGTVTGTADGFVSQDQANIDGVTVALINAALKKDTQIVIETTDGTKVDASKATIPTAALDVNGAKVVITRVDATTEDPKGILGYSASITSGTITTPKVITGTTSGFKMSLTAAQTITEIQSTLTAATKDIDMSSTQAAVDPSTYSETDAQAAVLAANTSVKKLGTTISASGFTHEDGKVKITLTYTTSTGEATTPVEFTLSGFKSNEDIAKDAADALIDTEVSSGAAPTIAAGSDIKTAADVVAADLVAPTAAGADITITVKSVVVSTTVTDGTGVLATMEVTSTVTGAKTGTYDVEVAGFTSTADIAAAAAQAATKAADALIDTEVSSGAAPTIAAGSDTKSSADVVAADLVAPTAAGADITITVKSVVESTTVTDGTGVLATMEVTSTVTGAKTGTYDVEVAGFTATP